MNAQKLIVASFLALSLAAISVKAVILPGSDIGGLSNAQPGDLVIGFRNASSSSDFAVDIGQFTTYENVAPGTYTIRGFKTSELISVFANAFTTAGTVWTVFGGTGNNQLAQPDGTLWATSNGNLTRATNQGSLSHEFDAFVASGLWASSFGGNSDANVLSAPKLFTSLGSVNSYRGAFAAQVESTTVGSTSLKLWELLPGTGAGTLLGTFYLDSAGLTFTVSAIPEPSTYAMILGAATLGFVALRRHSRLF